MHDPSYESLTRSEKYASSYYILSHRCNSKDNETNPAVMIKTTDTLITDSAVFAICGDLLDTNKENILRMQRTRPENIGEPHV